jgi:hypothetical protein
MQAHTHAYTQRDLLRGVGERGWGLCPPAPLGIVAACSNAGTHTCIHTERFFGEGAHHCVLFLLGGRGGGCSCALLPHLELAHLLSHPKYHVLMPASAKEWGMCAELQEVNKPGSKSNELF